MSDNKGSSNGGNIGAVIITIILAVFVFSGFSSCSGSGNKSDIAHDPNGFLGYSDSFWEWYADNN